MNLEFYSFILKAGILALLHEGQVVFCWDVVDNDDVEDSALSKLQ